MLIEILFLAVLVFVTSLVGFCFEMVSFLLGGFISEGSVEKFQTYECGYEVFEDVRDRFDIRFYLVALIFMVFDLETIYIFPYSSVRELLGLSGGVVMLDFVIELFVGLLYVWSYLGDFSVKGVNSCYV